MEGLVAQDACVVDDDVNTTVCVNGSLDDSLATFWCGNAVVVGNCFATCSADFINDLLGSTCVCTCTVNSATEVVHDHQCTA